jgi:hypothetical protein
MGMGMTVEMDGSADAQNRGPVGAAGSPSPPPMTATWQGPATGPTSPAGLPRFKEQG